MNPDSCIPLKDHRERQNPFLEVTNAEKQLWAFIHSKGLLQTEVQDLYLKVRSGYEKIILNNDEGVELHDIEYSLWKLHYKHIDEFRKRVRQTSANSESTNSSTLLNVANLQSSIDCHMERFKVFLSEATEFYQDLITKLRRRYELPEDPLFYENHDISCVVDPAKLRKCQFSCHRFLVCLGDLARYRELCKKLDFPRHDWSVAATYYFKATLVWPDSGNPQNQLALLATYVGDDYIAVYHCIRSLAIKEPFPDAWNNLILLFEKNRSSHLHSLSKEAHFNFLNPFERSTSLNESQSRFHSFNNDTLQGTKHSFSANSDLWPLFVRMISFFFIESSLDEFPCTFASTMREMDSLLALDDTELKATLESYQHMDSSRTGPYRALQMVSLLIFIVDSLTERSERKESMEKNNPMLIQSALIATFICMARLVERCMTGNYPLEFTPLLPPVLVFVEWLVGVLDKVETYHACEKVRAAVSYFFDAFVDLLNQLDKNESRFKYEDHTALWEDHELRGFALVARAHESLDFTIHSTNMGKFESRNVCRAHRIFHAATKIVDRSDGSPKWIFFDNLGRKFYGIESKKIPDQTDAEVAELNSDSKVKDLYWHRQAGVAESSSDVEVKDPQQSKCGHTKENGRDIIGEKESRRFENGKSVAVEEEEVILFKPITRFNSVPIHTSTMDDEMSMEGKKDQTPPSNECFRRAASLFMAQNQIDPLSISSDAGSFRSNMPFKHREPLLKETATYPAGPPSLSAWVLDREISQFEKEEGAGDFFEPGLSPIDEIAPDSLTGLSIKETKDSLVDSPQFPSSPPYSAPVPSAPFLPDDAIWFSGDSIKETDGILGASPLSSYANWSANHGPFSFGPSIPNLSNTGYQPVVGLSSSEWLHQYTNQQNQQNLDRANSHAWPVHFYAPGTLGNLYGAPHDNVSRFDLCDRWGNPLSPPHQLVYLESPQLHTGDQRREKLFHRPSPYGCGGALTEFRAEQPPLLQYLKEKEWQSQRQSQVRGPTYMGN
ncbi:hypothetical protein CsSME_00032000 [Camellia sinensis var. sinensis]